MKATTPENAQRATSSLALALSKNADLFPTVQQLDDGDFFERNRLLFGSTADVKRTTEGLTRAQPLIAELASDPSLRGVATVLSFAAEGIRAGRITLDQLAWPLSLADRTLSQVLSGKPATFSWQELVRKRIHRRQGGCGTLLAFNQRSIFPSFNLVTGRKSVYGMPPPIWTYRANSARRSI